MAASTPQLFVGSHLNSSVSRQQQMRDESISKGGPRALRPRTQRYRHVTCVAFVYIIQFIYTLNVVKSLIKRNNKFDFFLLNLIRHKTSNASAPGWRRGVAGVAPPSVPGQLRTADVVVQSRCSVQLLYMTDICMRPGAPHPSGGACCRPPLAAEERQPSERDGSTGRRARVTSAWRACECAASSATSLSRCWRVVVGWTPRAAC